MSDLIRPKSRLYRLAVIAMLAADLTSCVIWKHAETVGTPAVDAKITDLSRKTSFDTAFAPESSGVENIFGNNDYFLTHGDSFCPSSLYGLQLKNGQVVQYEEFRLKGAVQFDWEDLASSFTDKVPTLYLGDIGDNWRFRTWKSVYVITEMGNGYAYVDRRIRFRCVKNQKTVYADTEALFHYRGHLYVLTKNYGRALLFRIPLEGQNRVNAEYRESLSVPSLITSAAVNRDQTLLAVLSLDYLYLYDIRESVSDLNSKILRVYSTGGCRQCEGVCFTADGEIAITNEQGDLYIFRPDLP